MISHQRCPGTRDRHRHTNDEVRGLAHDVRGALGTRAFELEEDQANAIDPHSLRIVPRVVRIFY